MKKQFLFILLLAVSFNGFSQNEKDKLNAIGISIPVIWNNSEATYYSGNKSSGKSTSYGIALNYSRSIYKNLYGIVGVGYFKQRFGIERPFKFDDPTNLLFFTKSYNYSNIHYLFGIGYRKLIGKEIFVKGNLSYNLFSSFRQEYTPTRLSNSSFQNSQINKKSMLIGSMLNTNIGIEKKIGKRISFGLDIILPILTHWNNDEIFFEYANNKNTQQIARNKFSIGTMIFCNYHF